ncbi:Rad52/Rad22 family DNA repair protein [Paenibacillus prosopidis]|uniref:Rad52/22 family double-strand break repair protein n=1 Tax=Paenibacillus prosopidis TaxID=630520 RepID=A0A368VXH3_9BACL|nr:Rad52/Rad22 family DNA repair protein [Paenibacillus prosopidis]RCW44252.1 Rad52/22 family double-strand break repair protein [Paenibacillus prosopidis]
MDDREIMKRLQDPFLPDEIEWRVGSTNGDKTKGIALAYVTNRAIQNRLDEVFGVFGWRNEFREWKNNSQLCGISVKVDGEWVTKWDGADDSNMEAVKGGLSDAMKRAAYQWGIGRYLYNLESVWVDLIPAGKSHKMKAPPKLPAWALPEGYSYGVKPVVEPHQDIPPPALKAKYELFKGSMEGFESWVSMMQEKGRNYREMEHILQEGLNKKKESA